MIASDHLAPCFPRRLACQGGQLAPGLVRPAGQGQKDHHRPKQPHPVVTFDRHCYVTIVSSPFTVLHPDRQCVFARPRVTGHWASERKVSGEQRQQLQCQVCPTTMPKLCPPAIRHSNTVLAFTASVQISGGCKLVVLLSQGRLKQMYHTDWREAGGTEATAV